MRVATGALLLALLAGCQAASTHSLVGEWVMMDGVLQYPRACGAHGPITYAADGRYFIWGETGTWHLRDGVLTETMTGFDPMHVDRSNEEIGKPDVSTIKWVAPDRFTKHFADGAIAEFRRCPARD